MLLDDILRLEREKKVSTSPDLPSEIVREANTTRGHYRSKLLTPELKQAAKDLRDNQNIVIRKADKSSTFVILDKEEYMNKISSILGDVGKFKKITRNPTTDLKTRLNRTIRAVNKIPDAPKIPLIEGDYRPGYAYGNVKTHKRNFPLRPIISQIPSVTYRLAKRLNDLITPFTPANHSLKSSQEFIDILKASRPSNIIASMDVESLFTNVPVDATINMICDRLYRADTAPFPIPEASLRTLLNACTKEVPFYGPDGNMYVQTDGVAMGSPLGVLFANFYMGTIEENIFSSAPHLKPAIYTRYIDDIFISASSEEHISTLIETFKQHSCLNFTHEMELNQQLPFLDVLVRRKTTHFSTEVYVKPTNLGFCLNASSECPEKYRRSVIDSFVKRALTHCSSWSTTHAELSRTSQLLANNGYKQSDIDQVIRSRLDKFMQPPSPATEAPQDIVLFYMNYMSSSYKRDEQAINKIVKHHVTPTDANTRLKLQIYYRTKRTSTLVIRNNCLPQTDNLQETSLIYRYTCNVGDCSLLNQRYIGLTTTTLSKRITAHLQDGAIKRHSIEKHDALPTRKQLEAQTTILHREQDKMRLRMAEAVFIYQEKPAINIQIQPDSTLPSQRRGNSRPAAHASR